MFLMTRDPVIALAIVVAAFPASAFADNPYYVTVTPLHSFANPPGLKSDFAAAEGGHPRAGLLVGADGRLYGSTWLNGPNMKATNDKSTCDSMTDVCPGTIFSLDTTGGNFKVIHAFSALAGRRNDDGYQPAAALTQGPDGVLYGVASKGGQPASGTAVPGCGVVFKLMPDGSKFTTVHSLCSSGQNLDGSGPYGQLALGRDGYLYGSASHGGSSSNGVIFKMSTDGKSVANLHSFPALADNASRNNAEGAIPYGSPVFGDQGTLYGFTPYGGAYGRGSIYSVTTNGGFSSPVYTSFGDYTFTGNTDNAPLQGLIKASDGNFYGATEYGGANGTGTVFKITSDGVFTALHEFSSISVADGARNSTPDGALPLGTLLEGSDGNLYGTTYYGGENGTGGIFEVRKDGVNFALIYSFGAGSPDPDGRGANSEGNYPYAGLVQDASGNFFGTTFKGGANGFGTVYKMSAPLTFPAVIDAPIHTVVTSRTIIVSTLNGSRISIIGGMYSINGGAFTGAPGSVATGDTLAVRLTSALFYRSRNVATLSVGGVRTSFSVTTAPRS